MTPIRAHRLFLDFDGVIADSLAESQLVSWYGYHRARWSVEDPVPALQQRLPLDFPARFSAARNFARTLGEFIVPAVPSLPLPSTQAEFATAFASVPTAVVQRFVIDAQLFRDGLRSTHLQDWIALHTVFAEVAELMRGFAGRVHVVTAKDERSARAVLRHHGLESAVVSVLGDEHDKGRAVGRVLAHFGESAASALFIDDNIDNALAVRSTGVPALWARWGWQQAPEHAARARRLGLGSIDLADLTAIAAAQPLEAPPAARSGDRTSFAEPTTARNSP
jgi:phosphoglycolate phosphatase-like HAD superfamily hydrolase